MDKIIMRTGTFLMAAVTAAACLMSPAAHAGTTEPVSVEALIHPAGHADFCLSVSGRSVVVVVCGEKESQTLEQQQWFVSYENGFSAIAWKPDPLYCLGVQRASDLSAGLTECGTAKSVPLLYLVRMRGGWEINFTRYLLSVTSRLEPGFTFPVSWSAPSPKKIQSWVIEKGK